MAEPPIYINPLVTGAEGGAALPGGDARPQAATPYDHKILRNVGTRSHAEIDEQLAAAAGHAANKTIHFARGSLTHSELQGVGGTKSHAEIDELLAAAAAHAADEAAHLPHDGLPHSALRDVGGTKGHAEIDRELGAASAHAADGSVHFTRASLTHAELRDVGETKSHAEIDERLAAAAAHAADGSVHFPAASIQLSAAPGGESLVASAGPRTIKAMIAGPGIKITGDPDTLTIAADAGDAPARLAALEARTQNAGATPGVTTLTGLVAIAPAPTPVPAGLVAAVASDPPPQAKSGGYASANGWTFTTAKQITIAAIGMAANHYIGGGTRRFRFWRQPTPGTKLFDVTFDPANARPDGAFLRQMLEAPMALPPGDYVIMVDTNGQDVGDNRVVNTVPPDLTKVFGAFNQDPGGYPYQIENRHAQPTIGTFWYVAGALAPPPAARQPVALSVAERRRARPLAAPRAQGLRDAGPPRHVRRRRRHAHRAHDDHAPGHGRLPGRLQPDGRLRAEHGGGRRASRDARGACPGLGGSRRPRPRAQRRQPHLHGPGERRGVHPQQLDEGQRGVPARQHLEHHHPDSYHRRHLHDHDAYRVR